MHRGATHAGTDIGSSLRSICIVDGIPNHKPDPNEMHESQTHVLSFLS